ncbi:MAG: peptide chain release factor N(5)-glutamine methyltransferase [Candidatus Zixiibacteriota bacterium]
MVNLSKFITDRAFLLEQAGIDQGKAEIELILCHLLGVERLKLYMAGGQLLTAEVLERFDKIMNRRLERYPLQYILGEAWFYGRKFTVSEAVMVPTPETELLCELALKRIREMRPDCPRLLDIGVGSGVIAVTLANELDRADIVAVDISQAALAIARKNAAALGGEEKIEFRRSDLFEAVRPDERFDIILSNPPYISDEDYRGLPPEVLADPKIALVAGELGLDVIDKIISRAPDFLKTDGRLMFEIGYNQAARVAQLTEQDSRYRAIDIVRDLNDIDRVVILGCGN